MYVMWLWMWMWMCIGFIPSIVKKLKGKRQWAVLGGLVWNGISSLHTYIHTYIHTTINSFANTRFVSLGLGLPLSMTLSLCYVKNLHPSSSFFGAGLYVARRIAPVFTGAHSFTVENCCLPFHIFLARCSTSAFSARISCHTIIRGRNGTYGHGLQVGREMGKEWMCDMRGFCRFTIHHGFYPIIPRTLSQVFWKVTWI